MKGPYGWALGAATALALASPASAHDDRYRDDYSRGYRQYDTRGAYGPGFERGYQEGAREGARDARGGRRLEYWREGRYRDGDHGYRSSYGPRWDYTRGFRRGYEEGYRRGYASRQYDGRYYQDRDYDDRVIYETPRRY